MYVRWNFSLLNNQLVFDKFPSCTDFESFYTNAYVYKFLKGQKWNVAHTDIPFFHELSSYIYYWTLWNPFSYASGKFWMAWKHRKHRRAIQLPWKSQKLAPFIISINV